MQTGDKLKENLELVTPYSEGDWSGHQIFSCGPLLNPCVAMVLQDQSWILSIIQDKSSSTFLYNKRLSLSLSHSLRHSCFIQWWSISTLSGMVILPSWGTKGSCNHFSMEFMWISGLWSHQISPPSWKRQNEETVFWKNCFSLQYTSRVLEAWRLANASCNLSPETGIVFPDTATRQFRCNNVDQ